MTVQRFLFGEQVLQTKALLDRVYKRDKRGRFGSGSGGVRESLANAKSIGEVEAAMAGEAKAITGRDLEVDFSRSDVQIAREHAEGVLKGMEQFPGTNVTRVAMSDLPEGVYGRTLTVNDGEFAVITFGRDAQRYGAEGYRGDLKNQQMEHSMVAGTPQGVALHEFGHAVANQYHLNGWANNRANQYAETDMNMTDTQKAASKAISYRASENNMELSAEAFADVMVHGTRASGMSQLIMDKFAEEVE